MAIGTGKIHNLLSRQRLRLRKEEAKIDVEASMKPMDVFKKTMKHDIVAGAYYTRQAMVPLTRTADFVLGTAGNALEGDMKKIGLVGGVTLVLVPFGVLGLEAGLFGAAVLGTGVCQMTALVGTLPKALGSALGAGGGAIVGLPHAVVAAHQQKFNPRPFSSRPPIAMGDNVFTAVIDHCGPFLSSRSGELTDLLKFLQVMNGPAVRYKMTDNLGNMGDYIHPTADDYNMKEFVSRTLGKPIGIFQIVFDNGGKQSIHGEDTNAAIFVPESVGAFERAMTEAFVLGATRRHFLHLQKLLMDLGTACYNAKVTELNKYLRKKDLCNVEGDEFKLDFNGKESDIDRAAEVVRVSHLKALVACRRGLGLSPNEDDSDVADRPEFAQRYFNAASVERDLKASGVFDTCSVADIKELVRQLDEDLIVFG